MAPFTINGENLTRSANGKWMSHIPEIISMQYTKHIEAVISSG
jgi:hypothetical protein